MGFESHDSLGHEAAGECLEDYCNPAIKAKADYELGNDSLIAYRVSKALMRVWHWGRRA